MVFGFSKAMSYSYEEESQNWRSLKNIQLLLLVLFFPESMI